MTGRMDCYCGMVGGECPYDIDGVCHNEIDATECSIDRPTCLRCSQLGAIDSDSGWCQDCLWSVQ